MSDARSDGGAPPRRVGRAARGGRLVLAVLAAGLALGCAKPGPPGGGPADETPPEVVATRPAEGTIRVDRGVSIEIGFNEEMNRQTVERSLAVVPPVDLRNFRWKGRTLVAQPASDLPESTTVVVRVGEAASDYHGVAIAKPYAFAFSTGDAIDRGVIQGTVTARGQPVASAVVWACRPPVVPDSLGTLSPCGYAGATDENGAFRITNVRPGGLPYSLVAFIDGNTNRRYDAASEAGRILPNAAFLPDAGDSVGGIEIPLAEPGEEREDDRASDDGAGDITREGPEEGRARPDEEGEAFE